MLFTYVTACQDPSTNSARHARLQICTSFIRIAKTADKSVLPHMKVVTLMIISWFIKGALYLFESVSKRKLRYTNSFMQLLMWFLI